MPPSKDAAHNYFTSRDVRKANTEGRMVTSTYYKCVFCNKEMVFSSPARLAQHLSGNKALAEKSGGWGPCPSVPEAIADQFKKKIQDKSEAKKKEESKTSARERNDEEAGATVLAGSNFFQGMPKIAAMFEVVNGGAMDEAFQDLAYTNPQIPASFLCGNAFKKFLRKLRQAPASWAPPKRHRLYGDMLDDRKEKLVREVHSRADAASTYGCTIAIIEVFSS